MSEQAKHKPHAIVGRLPCGCLRFFSVDLGDGHVPGAHQLVDALAIGATLEPMSMLKADLVLRETRIACKYCQPENAEPNRHG